MGLNREKIDVALRVVLVVVVVCLGVWKQIVKTMTDINSGMAISTRRQNSR